MIDGTTGGAAMKRRSPRSHMVMQPFDRVDVLLLEDDHHHLAQVIVSEDRSMRVSLILPCQSACLSRPPKGMRLFLSCHHSVVP